MSTSQPTIDSRPISEIDPEYAAGPMHSPVHTSTGRYIPDSGGILSHPTPGRKSRSHSGKQSRTGSRSTTREHEILPSEHPAKTVDTLTNAIKQGLRPNNSLHSPSVAKASTEKSNLRMPFQDGPSSPTSVYTDVTGAQMQQSAPPPSYEDHIPCESKTFTITKHNTDQYEKEYERSDFTHDLPTPSSHMSAHPIVGADNLGMNSRIPVEKRPPKLDINAVREAEKRGSMTSLSDLIRRATRLASNLDRGRTASSLGHLNMFGSTDQLPTTRVRNSTYSDIMAAFPPPADRVGTPAGNRPNTMWPLGEKKFLASKSSLGRTAEPQREPKRLCCGLSPPMFALVLVVVVLLVAAAVLVPIFLIVVIPRQHKTVNLNDCPSTSSCRNGGVSVVSNNACSCVCTDGFTGSDCTTEQDPECVTASLADGSRIYENATVGSSILPVLQKQQQPFGVSLNTTTILSTFARYNLSCTSENSLVDFGFQNAEQRTRRFVVLPGIMSHDSHIPTLDMPPSELQEHRADVFMDDLQPAAERLQILPSPTLHARQDGTQSANGIVFATSTQIPTAPTVTASVTPVSSAGTATSTSAQPTRTIAATDQQLEFAATVVLYVLQHHEISVAVNASRAIRASFQSSNLNNQTVQVVGGTQSLSANFDTFQITYTNGTVIGMST
ncbi:hypothetical protein LTR64_007046 [Lithohypha guttulata]|uniref:uncharacterized protein n=1 Tax=Lithohypha guttulata TaxID=1690604 RepID=UPI00315D5303